MAKVYPKERNGVHEWLGEDRWCEVVAKKPTGEKVHYLYKCDVEIRPFKKAGPTIAATKDGRLKYLIPINGYGEYIVVWDEKPVEPYFTDGWPELEVLGEG